MRTVAALAGLVLVSAALASCATATTAGQPQAAPTRSAAATASSTAGSSAPATGPTSTSHAPAAPNPCAGNAASQLVHVSIARQHAWLCSAGHLALSTPVTTGMTGEYTETPTGTYRIQAKDTDTTLTQLNGDTYPVKYWIAFDAPLYGFHDASWQHFPYGSPRYRTDGSHGCIHVPLPAIRFLYTWAQVGATVRIDP